MRWSVLLTAAIATVFIRPVSTQVSLLDVPAMLDRYAEGRFDDAIRPISNATEEQARMVRAQLQTAGRLWIDAPGHSRADRLAVVALFALETEALRAERGDWAAPTEAVCAGRCVIEWACALLHERNDVPDQFEREWLAATVSLASGVRDWAFLYTPRLVAEPFGDGRGHVRHATARFPDDVRFRFARALAVAARFEPTTEQDQPREGARLAAPTLPAPAIVIKGSPASAAAIGQSMSTAATRRATQRALMLKELEDLSADATVGVHARTRLAYFHWAGGDYDAALAAAEAAAGQASDADARYLARYIAGMAAQSSGALSKAEALFASALAARPHSQSASITLAALLFQRGDANAAYALSQESLTKRKDDDDPWRLFQYGDYAKLPVMVQALRRAVPGVVK